MRECVYDKLRSVVARREDDVIHWNSRFLHLRGHYASTQPLARERALPRCRASRRGAPRAQAAAPEVLRLCLRARVAGATRRLPLLHLAGHSRGLRPAVATGRAPRKPVCDQELSKVAPMATSPPPPLRKTLVRGSRRSHNEYPVPGQPPARRGPWRRRRPGARHSGCRRSRRATLGLEQPPADLSLDMAARPDEVELPEQRGHRSSPVPRRGSAPWA